MEKNELLTGLLTEAIDRMGECGNVTVGQYKLLEYYLGLAFGLGADEDRKIFAHRKKVLKIKDEIDKFIEDIKHDILVAGRSVSSDFAGVVGRQVKCVVRKYGDRYKSTNPEFIKEIIIKRTDGDKVDEYLENKGKLPEGVMENIREEKLTIIVPKENDTTIGQISS